MRNIRSYLSISGITVMRRIIGTLWIIAITLIALGCATTGKGAIFSGTPIALVSVVSNYDINWKGEEPTSSSVVSDAIRRIMRANEDWVIVTKADIIIDEAEEIIRSSLEKSPQVTLAPKEDVFNARSYNEARLNTNQANGQMVKPAGYRMVFHRDKNFFPNFAKETGIDKTLFITLDLTKEMSSGIGKNGSYRGRATMTVLLKDMRGKDLFNKIYEVPSRDNAKVTSGAYSQEELLELLRSAINDACLDFLDDLK